MAIVLGPSQHGKAETRVVRVYRDNSRHEIRDLNVSTLLRGDFAEAHIRGDQASVLPRFATILLPPSCHPARRPDRRLRRSGPDL